MSTIDETDAVVNETSQDEVTQSGSVKTEEVVSEKVENISTETVEAKKRRFRPHFSHKTLTILGIALVFLLNGGMAGASWYLHKHPKKKTLQQVSLPGGIKVDTTNNDGLIALNSTTANNDASVSTSPDTAHYVSKAGGVEFDYPTNWHIDSTSDDSLITIKTATFAYKSSVTDVNSSSGTLQITIKKHLPNQTPDFDFLGNGIIAETPILITYTSPTKIQRKSTLLNTYHGLNDPHGSDAYAAFISGSTLYAVGDKITSKDLSKVDPIIGMYVQLDCGVNSSQSCDFINPGPINNYVFNNVPTFQNAKKIIESLRFNQ